MKIVILFVSFFLLCLIKSIDSTPVISSPKAEKYDVVIVGAGLSGIGAANVLLKHGLKILIIEATDRVGGRTNTIQHGKSTLELGAQWLHSSMNDLYDVAVENGLISDTVIEEALGDYLTSKAEIIDPTDVYSAALRFHNLLDECLGFVNAPKYPKSIGHYVQAGFDEWIGWQNKSKEALYRGLFKWHVYFQEIDNGCNNLWHLSAKNWGLYNSPTGEDRTHISIIGGYKAVTDIIVSKLPEGTIRLNTPATKIRWNDDGPARVECEDGTIIESEGVIMTASVGYLKAEHENIFDPPLPPKMKRAVDCTGFEGILKLFLEFPYRWWSDDFQGFQLVWQEGDDVEDKWTGYVTGFDPVFDQPNMLLGWLDGEGAAIVEELDDATIAESAVRVLKRFTGYEDIPLPVAVVKTTWGHHKWTRGSYSHVTSECDPDVGHYTFAEPVGKRLVLAGEHASEHMYTTAHGAYDSGKKQATLLMKQLDML